MQGNLFIEYPAKADVLIYNIIAVAEINNLHLGIYAAIRIRKKFILQRQYIRMMFFFTSVYNLQFRLWHISFLAAIQLDFVVREVILIGTHQIYQGTDNYVC